MNHQQRPCSAIRAHAGENTNIYVGVEIALELALDRLRLGEYRCG